MGTAKKMNSSKLEIIDLRKKCYYRKCVGDIFGT